jgi:hypothetical protein
VPSFIAERNEGIHARGFSSGQIRGGERDEQHGGGDN